MNTPADITLVVMAGGLGSRFGGTKQLIDVGPDGEAFLDYAIRDAVSLGLGGVVVIARTDLDEALAAHLHRQHGDITVVTVVHQDVFGPHRAKPWGTGHAVLSAADALSGPAIIINADDHYGPTGIQRAVDAMCSGGGERAVLVAFELGHTLSASGPVSRGVCRVDGDRLVELVETHGIRREGDGIVADDPPGSLAATEPVSMNQWGLPAAAVDRLGGQWVTFHHLYSDDPSAEFLLPEALDEQRSQGLLEIEVVRSDEQWIGITGPADLEVARAAFAVDAG